MTNTNGQALPDHVQRASGEIVAKLSAILAADLPMILDHGWYGLLSYEIELDIGGGELGKVTTTTRRSHKPRSTVGLPPSRAHVSMSITKVTAIAKAIIRDIVAKGNRELVSMHFEINSQDGCVQHVRTRFEAVHRLNPQR